MDVNLAARVRRREPLVALRGVDGDDRAAVSLEAVDAREAALAAAEAENELPRRDGAQAVPDHQRAVADQQSESRDRRLARVDGPGSLGVLSVPHGVPDELASGGADEQVLAAAVEPERRDLARDRDFQRRARLLARRPAHQPLLLHDAVDAQG